MNPPGAAKQRKRGAKYAQGALPAQSALSAHVAAPERLQVAALPWRDLDGLEIMLVSSRATRRWIIPKGWPMAGRSDSASASIEAIEEAGLLGAISTEPVGFYTYPKRFSRTVEPCRVDVYALRVARQRETWPEKHERATRWFPAAEAMEVVSDPELGELIAGFIRSHQG